MEFVEPIKNKKQIDAMKKYLRGQNVRDYLLLVLGINSGLRISDLLRLNIEDVYKHRSESACESKRRASIRTFLYPRFAKRQFMSL
ncbi:hypothetical protein [Paenibacillus sp. S-12]|uniref:hypothetical protein n=1 Tax=Paenibacillus sp. S-12 TaxID=3031371 RepID=UPI0033903EFE